MDIYGRGALVIAVYLRSVDDSHVHVLAGCHCATVSDATRQHTEFWRIDEQGKEDKAEQPRMPTFL